jgi:hypothetical protein
MIMKGIYKRIHWSIQLILLGTTETQVVDGN